MDLSVVIVSWNTRDLLRDCLTSVFLSTKDIAFEVLVIDNASSDGSGAMVSREFPQARLIANVQNVGYGAANNQGIRASTGELVLFLNPDTRVDRNAIGLATKRLLERPDLGALTVRLVNANGTFQKSCAPFPTSLFRVLLLEFLSDAFGWTERRYGRERPVDWCIGAFLMVRRSALDRAGLFKETIFLYAEDMDLCYRIRNVAGPIHYFPDLSIIHYGNRSMEKVENHVLRKFQHQRKGEEAFFRSYLSQVRFRRYCTTISILSAAFSRLYTIFGAEEKAYKYKALHQAYRG